MFGTCLLLAAMLINGEQNMEVHNKLNPKLALVRLTEGNKRFVSGNVIHKDMAQEGHKAFSPTQKPYVAILGCSDSRVPLEIIFDEGFGDIFVVRVAGNVTGPMQMESLLFSSQVLEVPLIVVLGHEYCGAVSAVLNRQDQLISVIGKEISEGINKDSTLEQAVIQNVMHVVSLIKKNPLLAKRIENGELAVKGGYYHVSTGKVDLLD